MDVADRSNDRVLPRGFSGDIFVWDIDKTYLDTHFSSWRGLLRIPFELAIDKVAIPGSVPLLRALRRSTAPEPAPLYFVSGSPKQLRRTIERKMTLDGIGFDGITFKDQWGLFRTGRWRDLESQFGYKLIALLGYARAFDDAGRWWMFGDDVEQDAAVFAMFGRVLSGLRDRALKAELSALGVHRADQEEILALTAGLAVRPADPVARIFILAHRRPDAEPDDPRVVIMPTFLAGALELAHLGIVPPNTVSAVAKDLRSRNIPERALELSVRGARRRSALAPDLVDRASGFGSGGG
jgi:phosphatidate phosphatase APP1